VKRLIEIRPEPTTVKPEGRGANATFPLLHCSELVCHCIALAEVLSYRNDGSTLQRGLFGCTFHTPALEMELVRINLEMALDQ
jgi:hypothetical protein